MRRRAAVLGVGLLAAVAGCGGREERAVPASLVPADAAVYVEAEAAGTDEARRLAALLDRVLPGTRPPAVAVELAATVLDAPRPSAGEVRPWMGERAALFAEEEDPGSLAPGVLLEVRDRAGAQRFLRDVTGPGGRRTVRHGVEIRQTPGGQALALVDEFLVLADSPEMAARVVDASRGRSLADVPAYRSALGRLPDDASARGWVHADRLAAAFLRARRREDIDFLRVIGAERGTIAGALVVDGRTAELEIRTSQPLRRPAPSVVDLPANAWLARGSGDLAADLRGLLGVAGPGARRDVERFLRRARLDLEDDVLSWIGRGSLFLQGGVSEEIAGTLDIEVKDGPAAADALAAMAATIRRDGRVRVLDSFRDDPANAEVSLELPGGLIAHAEVIDDALTVELGSPGSARTLGETPRVRTVARVLGGAPDLWLDASVLADILLLLGVTGNPARELLASVEHLTGRTARDGDGSLTRYALTLDEPVAP